MNKPAPKNSGEKLVAKNPVAFQNYFLTEKVEAGMVLQGTEIKSLRNQSPNLRDAFVEVRQGKGNILEAWLLNAHIPAYSHGNIWNHEPMRARKLLLHEYQIKRIYGAMIREGMTVVPTRLYLKNGRAKIEIALAKGKKKHDKRETLKQKAVQREMDQARKQKL